MTQDKLMLEGRKLIRTVGTRKIIDNVDLELLPGEISVIIGPSGSGKTTLLKLLAMLEPPDSGTIVVNEREYTFPSDKKIPPPWPLITVVFQQLFLWPHLTLFQNIKLPLTLRSGWKPGLERRKNQQESVNAAHSVQDNSADSSEQRRLEDLIELFDMGNFVHRYPNESSVGQRQRAALVRALVLQPEYLLLDEITSALDVEQISIILSYLKRLSKKGIGILIITHLLNFAREAADKVIFMDAGQIIESGGREVLDSPAHERVKKFLSVIESAS